MEEKEFDYGEKVEVMSGGATHYVNQYLDNDMVNLIGIDNNGRYYTIDVHLNLLRNEQMIKDGMYTMSRDANFDPMEGVKS